jgi:UDP-glucose 4-epimerase
LESVFEKHADEIALVLHFAAKKAVWESCHDPFLYYENNIIWTVNLLKVMDKYNVNQIIFSSSATVYDAENLFRHSVRQIRLKLQIHTELQN